MISWIDKEYKNEYKNSAKASGIRYRFYTYEIELNKDTKCNIEQFISFLRKHYYFPIRLNILFCNTTCFKHNIDKHIYYGSFYSMDDEKKKTYPRISIAAMVNKHNSINDVLFTLAHEITHYYQWYFLEEDKRTRRSLEIEANKWAKYILDLYLNQ
ncbi:MAG: hypothetical protein IJY14_03830 [Acholeplasmatales bacterium]|nr:hypothetical protein [Acholeplasmatales bacterium]